MKVDLNIADFLTEEHKKSIQDKITKAIEDVDVSKLTKQIEAELLRSDLSVNVVDFITENLDFDALTKPFSKFITDSLKEKLK